MPPIEPIYRRKFGRFHGFLDWRESDGGGDEFELNRDLVYEDPTGELWTAPAGAIVNGASIPRPLWTLIGHPFRSMYAKASVIHDVYYGRPDGHTRAQVDRAFRTAMRRCGCGPLRAWIMWAGVRLFGWTRFKGGGQ